MMKLPVTSCSLLRPLNHLNSFHRGMFKFNAKLDADLLPYSLSHFECDGHTIHMLPQRCLPPPLTSTVKSSVFTHMPSSPLSLAARLQRRCTNCSRYINDGWSFSGQTMLYIPFVSTYKESFSPSCGLEI